MNKQPIEKRSFSKDGTISVHSIFRTIQGEGPFCGTPCVFIRLAGCNLQCPACDTEYTQGRRDMTVAEIINELKAFKQSWGRPLVVITGGEPFRQNLDKLIPQLIWHGHYVQVETNGTLPPSNIFWNLDTSERAGAYIVCSPKTGKVHPSILDNACALKYVVSHSDMNWLDGLPMTALEHPANPYPARPPLDWHGAVYVQPMDAHNPELNKLNNRAAVESCLKFGYTLQVQVHKVVEVE